MADAQSQSWSEKAEIIKQICSEAAPYFRAIGAELPFMDHARGVMRLPFRMNIDCYQNDRQSHRRFELALKSQSGTVKLTGALAKRNS